MIDCSRNAVMRPEEVCRWAKETKELGFNSLMLYTEDTYEVEGRPYFGYGRGRYTREELRQIDAYCRSIGVELIPCIQTLAHLERITRWKPFRPMIDVNDILLIDQPETYELIEDLFRTLETCFTSRIVNVGMDEAHLVGRGKYYDLHGDANRAELLIRHLERVAEIGKRHGFRLLMWSDMFFRLASGGKYYVADAGIDRSVSRKIPENVELIYWDYYSTDAARYDAMMTAHEALKPDAWFAGGLWTWTGFAPHNRYSMESLRAAMAACRKHGVKNVILTLWGDNGGECSRWAILPALYDAAMAAQGVDDPETVRQGFRERYGVDFDSFLLLDLPGSGNDNGSSNPDKYLLYNDPFTGLFDSTLSGGEAAAYGKLAGELAAVDAGEHRLRFRTLAALCRVLEQKADLGQRTRAAYAAGDRAALAAVAGDYDGLIDRLEAFYDALRAQWMAENKPQGFEVQDLRIGGLTRRIRSCRQTLTDYLNGRLASVEELEQPLLDETGMGEAFAGQPIRFNRWKDMVTASNV